MDKNFSQDAWSNTFCLIFNELAEKGYIDKKKTFTQRMGLPQQSTLNAILSGQRNFPLEHRQEAMKALREIYHVNLEFFQSTVNPMFTRQLESVPVTGGSKMTYAEMVQYQKCLKENEALKRLLEEKERLIITQAALITALQGKH